jgi:hypothetical protein
MAPAEYHKITLRLEFPFLSEVQTSAQEDRTRSLSPTRNHREIGHAG